MGNSLHDDYRVLVLAPFGKDAALVREVLERSGIPVGVVSEWLRLPAAWAAEPVPLS